MASCRVSISDPKHKASRGEDSMSDTVAMHLMLMKDPASRWLRLAWNTPLSD